ncbi:AI-2E family transporter [Flavobacterium silvaticum]|uniref:AI-2E family transporter n=1 Tax=Flavobacterium silvaticum TaxID=1852020 RepID=A0A972FWH7_9FLAO|nr:AI-2E family transporter [Flavobacterium silvaticum]NMH28925.1 AI-2E family transporter [Flavobacterium silvaticum]
MAGYYDMPFPLRTASILIILVLSLGLIYIAQGILVPIGMALLFAILLRPIARFLRLKLKFPHAIASVFAVAFMILIVVAIFLFISYQVADMANDWDKIKHNISIHIANLQEAIHDQFNLSKGEQQKMLNDATKDSMQTGKEIVSSTLLSVSDMLLSLVLIPIYTFLFLLYRTHFMKFLAKLVTKPHQPVLEDIMIKIKGSVQSYIIGLMIEMIAVSVLTSAGFMIIGLEYAILLGCITGLLNLIPYIGITIAGVLSIVASLSTNTDFSLIFGVIIVNVVVQLIDNNLLVPMIVSSKVEINAFVSIVGIIIGGALAGVAGMFLAIPFFAILKVIFDHFKPLEPWGYLFGDDLPKNYQWNRISLTRYGYDEESAHTTAVLPSENPTLEYTKTTTEETNEQRS